MLIGAREYTTGAYSAHTYRLHAQIEDGEGSCGRAGALPRRLALATELHEGAGSEPELHCSAAGPAFASCSSTRAEANNKMLKLKPSGPLSARQGS